MAFDWKFWLPLIFGGAQTGASIAGAQAQKGALKEAQQLTAEQTEKALKLLAGMFSLRYQNLAPYRSIGQAALPQLAKMSKVPFEMPPASSPGSAQSELDKVFSGAGLAGLGSNQPTSLGSVLGQVQPAGPGRGAAIGSGVTGTLAGMLAGGGIPGLANLPVSSGLGAAMGLGGWAGPIGIAAGVGAGALINRLTRAGRERKTATSAAEGFSDWVWKDIVPIAQREGWDVGKLQSTLEQGKRDYSDWITQNIKDTDVRSGSITSQFGYLDPDLQRLYAGWGSSKGVS